MTKYESLSRRFPPYATVALDDQTGARLLPVLNIGVPVKLKNLFQGNPKFLPKSSNATFAGVALPELGV